MKLFWKKLINKEKDMKISVIMASYLEDYISGPHKSATNREYKFVRAVDSYRRQSYHNSDLTIVSDGCSKTEKIYSDLYKDDPRIKLVVLPKQPQFSGRVRQAGIESSDGDLICYLDSDDMFGPSHLDIIAKNASGCDWYYYDDYLFDGKSQVRRDVKVEHCFIGTSSFCHNRSINLAWKDGYGHDWDTIKLISHRSHKKIETPEYLVCHVTGLNIDY